MNIYYVFIVPLYEPLVDMLAHCTNCVRVHLGFTSQQKTIQNPKIWIGHGRNCARGS